MIQYKNCLSLWSCILIMKRSLPSGEYKIQIQTGQTIHTNRQKQKYDNKTSITPRFIL